MHDCSSDHPARRTEAKTEAIIPSDCNTRVIQGTPLGVHCKYMNIITIEEIICMQIYSTHVFFVIIIRVIKISVQVCVILLHLFYQLTVQDDT